MLAKHSTDGQLHYSAFTKTDKLLLKQYLESISKIPEKLYTQWPKPQQLALLLNLYNANTISLILEHYPVSSIRDIGWFGFGPWGRDRVELFGDSISLDDLEHEIIRREFNEPRIHFALVCAAKSCPPLRSEPYLAAKLDAQLNDQAKQFMSQTEKNRVTDDGVVLSKIFAWYGEDFAADQSQLLKALMPHWPNSDQQALLKRDLKAITVDYSEYDWSLNEPN